MAISDIVQSALFENGTEDQQQLIRIPIRAAEARGTKRRRRSRRQDPPSARSRLLWKADEHDRFLEALELYPSGPWKLIADHIGTRTPRQTMTHAQKYRQKIERRKLKKQEESEDSTHDDSSSEGEIGSPYSAAFTSKTSTASIDEAMELSVLLEFLDNFQPSEIECATPFLSFQDNVFLLDVCM
ncbi:Myb domain-contaning protein [Phytophthora megakarya]|uniref:Myb domain-contaning protein n=1 Tax=Phytophthora megakarya TaxID=4795 RepID=A0A225VGG1_9STRA|nr:Myb domain-contaning protein [Phytophthora megakarya]